MKLSSFISIAFVFLSISIIDARGKGKGNGEHFKKMQNWHVLNIITYAIICDDKELTSCTNTMTPFGNVAEAIKTVQIPDDLKSMVCMSKEMRTKLRTLRKEVNENFKKYSLQNQEINPEELKSAKSCLVALRNKDKPADQPKEDPQTQPKADAQEKELKDPPVAVVKAEDNVA